MLAADRTTNKESPTNPRLWNIWAVEPRKACQVTPSELDSTGSIAEIFSVITYLGPGRSKMADSFTPFVTYFSS
jgi:hypothetical protein